MGEKSKTYRKRKAKIVWEHERMPVESIKLGRKGKGNEKEDLKRDE